MLGIKRIYHIDKFEFPKEIRDEAEALLRAGIPVEEVIQTFDIEPFEVVEFEHNGILNEGATAIWDLVIGGTTTNYSNTNGYVGVGDSSAVYADTQTGLQAATNYLAKGMDAGYPQVPATRKMDWRGTYGGTEANWAWEEFCVANGTGIEEGGADDLLNRTVSSQGTKTSGQTWVLTITLEVAAT